MIWKSVQNWAGLSKTLRNNHVHYLNGSSLISAISTVGIQKLDKSGFRMVDLSPDAEWSKFRMHSKTGQLCPVFKWLWSLMHLKTGHIRPNFECIRKPDEFVQFRMLWPFENRKLKSLVLEWLEYWTIRFSNPHCIKLFDWKDFVL
jgi:hypothetical protein